MDKTASNGNAPATQDADAELMTPSEVAERLSVSRVTVANYTKAGRIPYAVKIGRTFRYKIADVIAALNNE